MSDDWPQIKARWERALVRVDDWDGADHYEDCPAIPHIDHECDCPVIENDDDDTWDACRERCEDKAEEVCDCYLGLLRELRHGGRVALQRESEACDLLAVVHRDGGQHTGGVGFTQSCLDARAEVVALRQRVEELEQVAARIASEAACERLRAEAAEAKLARVVEIADHGIPFYAYADNEAAVEMSHRLEQILVVAKGK